MVRLLPVTALVWIVIAEPLPAQSQGSAPRAIQLPDMMEARRISR